jgi:hypothetical protein
MEKDSIQDKSLTAEQLEKYANDLSKIYDDEKAKRKELAIVYEQLANYAEDLNKNVTTHSMTHQGMKFVHTVLPAKHSQTGKHTKLLLKHHLVMTREETSPLRRQM